MRSRLRRRFGPLAAINDGQTRVRSSSEFASKRLSEKMSAATWLSLSLLAKCAKLLFPFDETFVLFEQRLRIQADCPLPTWVFDVLQNLAMTFGPLALQRMVAAAQSPTTSWLSRTP